MSEFVVSARKYRPGSFDSVVGQESITSTLENSIATGQMAQAYLFCGPRGVGKTSCARIFAKVINQDSSGEVEDLSFNIFELDAASNNSVEDIRQITDQVRIPPQVGKYKVYIIDEVHMLSQSAFNAFLKTLEEPPPHAIFILATTEKHKIIPTILSRCQVYNFSRISVEDMVSHLEKIAEKEGITYEKEALHIIAEKADGALRDSLSIFDQIVNFSNKNVTYQAVIDNLNVLDYNYYFKMVDSINKGDISNCLLSFDDILSHGFDGHHFITGMGSHFRDILVSKDTATFELLEVSENIKSKYLTQSKETELRMLVKGLEILSNADVNYKTSKNQRLLVELTLIKLCSLSQVEQKKNPVTPESSIPEKSIEKKEETKLLDTISEKIESDLENKRPESTEVISEKEEEQPQQEVEAPIIVKAEEKLTTTNPKVAVKGTKSKVAFSGFSINETLKEKEKEEKVIVKEDKDEFSEEEMILKWNAYAADVDKKNRKILFTAMTKNKPQLKEGYSITHQLDNKTLFDNFNREKEDFLSYLQQELNNYSITIQSELIKNEDNEVFLYTDKEKFKKLAESHPELIYLKDKLSLDFEF